MEVYADFLKTLSVSPETINRMEDIPFLPIQFFKTHKIINNVKRPELIFNSSGTTGVSTSTHYIADISLYKKSFRKGFNFFYGDPSQYCILALLPSYLEREGSSLVYMADDLIKASNHAESGFYLAGERGETGSEDERGQGGEFRAGQKIRGQRCSWYPRSLPPARV